MKKWFLIIATLSCVGAAVAATEKKEEKKTIWDGRPAFEGFYIKMHAQFGRCGGVTIVSKGNEMVRVLSRKFAKAYWWGKQLKPGTILSKGNEGWVEVPPGGFRARYDRPGRSAYYGVYCQKRNDRGFWENVPCSKVVDLKDVQHNRLCVRGVLGPNAPDKPLNMVVPKKPVAPKEPIEKGEAKPLKDEWKGEPKVVEKQ